MREDYSADRAMPGAISRMTTPAPARIAGPKTGFWASRDNHQRLVFCLGLLERHDPILKERLFGLNGHEGNHGEDVKEVYYYLDATPTHSYLKGSVQVSAERRFRTTGWLKKIGSAAAASREFELEDTGIFNESRYFDIFAEYARHDVDDIFIRPDRGEPRAGRQRRSAALPQLWFRNTWSWGRGKPKPVLRCGNGEIVADHPRSGPFILTLDGAPETLFTENETNTAHIFGSRNGSWYVKDAFHDCVVEREEGRGPAGGDGNQGVRAVSSVVKAGRAACIAVAAVC